MGKKGGDVPQTKNTGRFHLSLAHERTEPARHGNVTRTSRGASCPGEHTEGHGSVYRNCTYLGKTNGK